MGLLDKVKNFFYEDEYEEDLTQEVKPVRKEKKEKIKKEIIEDNKKEKTISERELFKAERTFNFPMDVDEEDFSGIKKQKEEITKKEPEKEIVKTVSTEHRDLNSYTGLRTYAKKEEKREEQQEVKRFKPTPIISPIYGILDKNYKKEDLVIDSSRDLNKTKKVDYDSVRRKAYSNAYTGNQEKSNDIFYNLDDKVDSKKEEDNEEVKIVYNDVTFDDDEDENITIGEKIEKYENNNQTVDEDDDNQILSETKEQDLFNLIDNMYNSDDEDDEEEE